MKRRTYQLAESIKEWPQGDQPRTKLTDKGARYLTDSELLAILIGSGGGEKNALDLARELLHRFENISSIEAASTQELTQVPGIGEAKAVAIKAGVELGRRFVANQRQVETSSIRTSEEMFSYYLPSMKNLRNEVFKVALLDAKNRLLKTVTVSEGGLTSSMVQPRDVFSPAIREGAPAVIVMHNHPSGDPEPSSDDLNLTRRLVDAGRIMNVHVLDHLIIGDGTYFSFADEDLL
jgi:DNA repair protein RadC